MGRRSNLHDYIVVGAGSSGCTVAGRLAEGKRHSVLVLEAGGSDLSPFIRIPAGLMRVNPRNYWHFRLEPDPTRNGAVDTWAAGRVVGGGSSVNAMLWVRGNRADFDTWAKLGAQGWDYESLLPAMRSLETWEGGADRYRGGTGPQHVSRIRLHHPLVQKWLTGAAQTGMPILADYNGESQFGAAWSQLSQKNGLRHSAAQAFLAPARRRGEVDVESHAVVDKVIIENGRAVGVEYVRRGTRKVAYAAKEVILSAGALCSPLILLRSGIGPAEELRDHGIDVIADLPGVGRNLQEHPAITMTFTVTDRTLNQELTPLSILKGAFDFVLRRRGPATAPLSHAMLFGPPLEPEGWPQYHVLMAPLGTEQEKPHATQEEAEQNRYDKQNVSLSRNSIVSAFMSPLHPRGRGTVRLGSPDVDATPVIEHPMLADERDVVDLTAAGRKVREIFQSPAMRPHVIAENAPSRGVETDDEWAEFIRNHCFGGSHWVGTARMGADSDPDAVVDPQLRVRGVSGLRVADASVMPTLTSGNTNAPCVLIGEKAAELIRGR
ncbi:glucose-methanol-choline oxidoreductase [Mycolicibacterium thermoresistibile]|nr:glucose-methanol-choline oxidoreductase [Mycolicibacterium thermoresistibile]